MATRSRPSQGINSLPNKNPRPAYVQDSAPRIVSRGSVSHPAKLPKWNPSTLVADRTPKIVQD